MKHKIFLLTALMTVLSCFGTSAQVNYRWTTIRMDSKYDEIKDDTATKIIAKYNPLVAPLQEIIGYSKDEYGKGRPESPLSNFAADIIRETAEDICGSHVDVALTNFGGIRTNLPKGAVRVYDIFSIFPFDNTIVVFDIKGTDLLKFLRKQARHNEALSNVRLVIADNRLKSAEIGGEQLDGDRIYKFATINFLMDGGDGVQLKDYAMNKVESDIFLRDAIVNYIRKMTAEGRTIDLKCDGRVIIEKQEQPAIIPAK